MEMVKVKEFIRLQAEEDCLEKQLKEVKGKLGTVEKELLDEFSREGVQNININGRTVYLSRKVVARPKGGRKEVIEALIAAGLADFINTDPNYNTQSLDAYIRGQEENGQGIPEPLQSVLEVTELFFVRSRKAS